MSDYEKKEIAANWHGRIEATQERAGIGNGTVERCV